MDKIEKKRACLLGLPIDVTTLEVVKNSLLEADTSQQVITINPEMVTKAYKDKELSELIKSMEWVIPDGIGVVMALKMIGVKTQRIPGIELAYSLLQEANDKGLKVAFIGADEDTIQTAKKELLKELPNLNFVYIHNGYFSKDEENIIIEEIQNASPDILLAGLGFPKQEKFLKCFKNFEKKTIMIGVGGSFDVWSRKLKRAPKVFQKLNLEWFYRLLCQPSRFSRMFPAIPLFLLRVPLESKLNRKEY